MDARTPAASAPASRGGNALIQLLALAALVAWVAPMLLEFAGLAPFGRWLAASGWHRMAVTPVLLVLVVLSHTSARRVREDRRRAAWGPFALSVGGTLEQAAPSLEGRVWQGGPVVRVPVRNGLVSYDVVRDSERSWTRVRAAVADAEGLAFQMVPRRAGLGALNALAGPMLKSAIASAEARAKTPEERRAIERLEFVAGPEVSLDGGDLDGAVSLRASHGDAARRLIDSPDVAGALRKLVAVVRGWQWSVTPDSASGGSLMELTLPGADFDQDHLHTAHDLITGALDHFAGGRLRAVGARPDAPR